MELIYMKKGPINAITGYTIVEIKESLTEFLMFHCADFETKTSPEVTEEFMAFLAKKYSD